MRMNARPNRASVRTGAASTPWGASPVNATMVSQPALSRMSALTSGKGTASRKFSKTCVRSAQATGTQSPSPNAAVTEGGAGVPTVRSALSRARWPSKSSAPTDEDL